MLVALAAFLALCVPLPAQPSEHLGRSLAEWTSHLQAADQIDRLLAARSIGEMAIAGDEDAAAALLGCLGHEDSSVRFWAAAASARLGEPSESHLAALRRALADEFPEVGIQAAVALIGAGEREDGLETIRRSLSHRNRGVRLHAAHAADAIGSGAAPLADTLRRAEEDEFDYVQRVARHALWSLGERPCPYRTCD